MHKRELSNLSYDGVRNVDMREELTIVTGMSSQTIKVKGELEFS